MKVVKNILVGLLVMALPIVIIWSPVILAVVFNNFITMFIGAGILVLAVAYYIGTIVRRL